MKPHHSPDGFLNNYPHAGKTFADFLKWSWDRTSPEPVTFPLTANNPEFLKSNRTETSLTWVGHSTFLLQWEGLNILTDPHFTERASPVSFAGPKRHTPAGLSLDQLPDIDVVIISHDHYDHLDLKSVQRLYERQKARPPVFLVPLRLKDWFADNGIPVADELDWWDFRQVSGLRFHCVPVQHFSGRSLTNRNSTLWCGWVIESTSGNRVFFAGDTGYSNDFKDIRNRLGDMTLSLIPVGAYDPRWFMQSMHVNPEEAVQIHEDVGSAYSVGMHWGTFILTDEPMTEPPARLAGAMKAKGLNPAAFTVMQHGETRHLNDLFSTKPAAVAEQDP